MSVRLSIATACYNLNEEYLRAHIERILSQLTDETELILIDDCSTNNTGEVCREYVRSNDHVRYIRMEKTAGSAASETAASRRRRESGFSLQTATISSPLILSKQRCAFVTVMPKSSYTSV